MGQKFKFPFSVVRFRVNTKKFSELGGCWLVAMSLRLCCSVI